MKQFLIQAVLVLGANAAATLATLESDITTIVQRVKDLGSEVSKIPTAKEFLSKFSFVNESIAQLGADTKNVALSLGDQTSLSVSYGQLEPVFLNLTIALTADVATLIEFNEDGSITDELDGIIITVDSTTTDVAVIAFSEAVAIEAVGNVVTSALSQLVQLI